MFVDTRSTPGSQSIVELVGEQAPAVGRFKLGRPMTKLGPLAMQFGNHAYHQAAEKRFHIPSGVRCGPTGAAQSQCCTGAACSMSTDHSGMRSIEKTYPALRTVSSGNG